MMRPGLVAPILLALAACSSPEQVSEAVGVEAAPGRTPATGAEPKPEPFAFTETEGDEASGQREFAYAWPREVSAIPELVRQMDGWRAEELAQQKQRWTAAKADCPEDFVSCRNDAFDLEWKVVADTPRFLSLSSEFYAYTGGAHGNYARSSLVWDREAGAVLDPIEVFTSPAAIEDALGERACDLLNREREKRRGAPLVPDAEDWASACVGITDTVLFLGSSGGAEFNRIGVYYAPYVAGPYAEGEFEFTLPVTEKVLAAVKPEYRDAFTLAR